MNLDQGTGTDPAPTNTDGKTPMERALGETGRTDSNDAMADPRDRVETDDQNDDNNDNNDDDDQDNDQDNDQDEDLYDDEQAAALEAMQQRMQAGPVVRPPTNWSGEEQQLFAAMPPELQHVVAEKAREMQGHFTQRMQEIAQVRKHYEGVDRQIQPRLQQWAMAGMNAETGLSQLLALSDFATSDPQGFVRYFAQQRGVDLNSLLNGQDTESENQYVDPQIAQAQARIAQLEQVMQQQAQHVQAQQQAQQQAQYQEAVQNTDYQIESFARSTDQEGNALFPYWDHVEGQIADLVNAGVVRDLSHAYEVATWADPQIRAQLLADQQASQLATLRAQATRARRASAPSSQSARGNESGDVSIRGQLERMM